MPREYLDTLRHGIPLFLLRFLQFLAELRLLLDTQERISYFAEGYDIE